MTLTEAEMDVVREDARTELPLAERQPDLGEDGIGVDVGEPRRRAILDRAGERAGDVEHEVGRGDDLVAAPVGEPGPLTGAGEPVAPALAEAEALHRRGEVAHIRAAVARDPVVLPRFALEDVGPLARILEVVDVVAEPREADRVLQIVPGDAGQRRVLRDEPADDDAQPRAHASASVATRSTCRGGPRRTIRPCSSSRTRSQLRSVLRRCAIMKWCGRARALERGDDRALGPESTALVGSSRSRIGASFRKARGERDALPLAAREPHAALARLRRRSRRAAA